MAPRALDDWLDGWSDLVLGSRCSGCSRPGRVLCASCEAALPGTPFASWPTPCPPGLVAPTSAGEYAGLLRALVVDHKEHRRLALARPLGRLLAVAVQAAWEEARGPGVPLVVDLVPVPCRPAVARGRGHDPLLRVARVAAGWLRARGGSVGVRPLLTVVGRPGDQAGLTAAGRRENVSGRFAARGRARRDVVLVDDVITTGATLREAQRALEAAAVRPLAVATVAATRRQFGAGSGPRLPNRGPGH